MKKNLLFLYLFICIYAQANTLKIIDTIKDLQSLDYKLNKCIYITGYNYPNDGGGGIFCFNKKKEKINDHGLIINGWSRVFSGKVNIRWFGANEKRIDNQKPIQYAIRSGYKVFIDKGVFKCNSSIYVNDRNVNISGQGKESIILFTNQNKSGFYIKNSKMNTIDIDNISIETSVLSKNSAIYISYANVKRLNRHISTVNLKNLYISGQNIFKNGWKNGIYLDEVTFPVIKNIEIYGRVNRKIKKNKFWSYTLSGISYMSSKNLSPVNPLFDNVMIKYVKTGFYFKGTMEGIRLRNCLVIASKIGLLNDRTELYKSKITNDPWLIIDGCHFNTSQYGIISKRTYEIFILNSLLYQFHRSSRMNYCAIYLSKGSDVIISNNIMLGNKFSNANNYGIKIFDVHRINIMGNHFVFIKNILEKNKSNDIIFKDNLIKHSKDFK